MFPNTRFFILVLIIVFVLWNVSESGKPVIWPNQEEILINEGDPLEITCNGTTQIKFIYPNNIGVIMNTSAQKIKKTEENGIYKFVFQRPNTVFGDTGWYGCADYNVDIMPNDYDNLEVNWIYVYVKSNTHFFVEVNTYAHLYAVVGNDIAIPCRTTSLKLAPILYTTKGETKKPFDPRIGFMMKNLTVKDSDFYRCSIEKDGEILEEVNYTLSVHERDIRREYINLTPQNSTTFYQREVGSSVEWLVYFDAYPKPHLQWKKYDHNITTKDNFFVNTTSTFTILKIKSLREMDEGVYTLVAKNQNKTKKLNFMLNVADKPISKLAIVKSYYAPNENAEFYCKALISVQSVTFPNITWNFRKCFDFPLCKNSSIVQLTNVHVMEQEPSMIYKNFISKVSKVKMLIEMPGKITCEACNAVGCDVSIETVLVSDGIGNFSIIGPNEPVIKGDDVEFTCVASIYYFTDKLKWKNLNNTLIVKSDRLHIMQYKTSFTHRSTLKINNVKKSDAIAYICFGKFTSLDTMANKTYKLVVHDPVKPFFYDTNMNQTKVRDIDMNTDDNILILICLVNGLPKPNMTWFKDNTTLMEDNQYSFKSDNQELNIKYLKQNDSGKYLCRATNGFGTNETYQQIRISGNKTVDNFSIIGPKELVKGDYVELTCIASVSYYTELAWINLTKTEKLRTVSNNTLFFYRSILKIDNVQESDAKSYICAGKYIISNNHNTFSTIKKFKCYELIVHDPVLPYFNKTNMNETIDIEMFPESHTTVTLQCFANGMPTPNVTWLKDNIELRENNQYSFKSDNQELTIKYFKQNDSGKYFCHATNRFNTSKTYQQIIIKNVKSEPVEQKPTDYYTILYQYIIPMSILGIISVILGIFITIKVRREKKLKKKLMETGLMHFVDGALECLNSDLTVENQAELLPYDKQWEFPRERLKLGKRLGSGEFGVVMKAEAQGIRENEIVTTVAVKMARRTTDLTYIRALASELKILVHLGKHLNVVNFLGACTKNISECELLVIVEYCGFGNLHNYLLKHRTNFINQIDFKTGKIAHNIGMDALTKMASVNSNNSSSLNSGSDTATYKCSKIVSTNCEETSCSTDGYIFSDKSSHNQSDLRSNYRCDCKDQNLKSICTKDLLSWAFQVACGMEYLSQRRVLHGDLAARNILLTEDNVVKICDFGLAKSMYKDGNYKKKGDGPLPLKWMAIESIKDRIFSTQSDIWSFGIMLWEFFTLAETPYPDIEVERLYLMLIKGYRMGQPKYANREVYDIMLQCWKAKPILRPSFSDLVESIGNLIEESVKSHYMNLNMPYMNINKMILESKTDYLTMMCAPDYAILSSACQNYVNTKSEQAVSEDASNLSYLCMMSPGSQTDDKSLIFSRSHRDCSELPTFASDLQNAKVRLAKVTHSE